MKKLSFVSLFVTLIAVTLTLGLTSCTKDNPVSTTADESMDFVSYGTLIDLPQVSDATIESDMKLMNEMQPQVVEKGGLFGGNMPMFKFREIFQRLNLTDDQKTEIRAIIAAHIDCEKAARLAFYEKISGIIQGANDQRKVILEALKNGEIDRKTAGQQLRDLNKATRDAIAASGAIEELRAALKNCNETMVASLKSTLTDEQFAKFIKWFQRMNKGGEVGS